MRQDNLPSPGIYVNSQRLRIEAAKAISHAEIVYDTNGNVSNDTLDNLRAFFQACADAVPTTVAPAAPVV